MNVPELVLHHQRLNQRAVQLRSTIERLRSQLASDPAADRLEAERQTVAGQHRELQVRLRRTESEVADQRSRLRAKERELMSGRIRNPSELMKLEQEVDGLKQAVRRAEDGELELMEEEERLERQLARLEQELRQAREASAAAAPELDAQLRQAETGLAAAEAERAEVWSQIPADWQQAYQRVSRRLAEPVAEVVDGRCSSCHVTVTSSGMQALRRAGLLLCDNCGRILVVT
jgi:predicted  nucleic acid-binding Zn-ribbon protein